MLREKRVYHFRELTADIVQFCIVRLSLDRTQNMIMSCRLLQSNNHAILVLSMLAN